MPGVNFGILQPTVQAPTAVTSAPPPPAIQPSPISSFAGGLTQGMLQGQQMQNNDLVMQGNQMQLDAQKKEAAVQAAMQAAAAGSKDTNSALNQQLELARKMGRTDLMAGIQETAAKLEGLVTKGKKDLADLTKTELENQKASMDLVATTVVAVMDSPDPIASYNKTGYKRISRFDKTAPKPGSDPEEISVYLRGAGGFAADYMNKLAANPAAMKTLYPGMAGEIDKSEANKNQPNTVKLQNASDSLDQQIQAAKQQGQDTTPLEIKKQQIQADISASGRGMSPSPLDTKLAESDASAVTKGRDDAAQAVNMMSTLDESLKILKETDPKLLGPVIDFTKLNKMSPQIQKLQSIQNAAALLAKSISGMPSNTFSEADRNFVAQIAGTTSMNKNAIIDTAQRLQKMGQKLVNVRYNQEDKIRKGSSTYKQWKDLNPDAETWSGQLQPTNSTPSSPGPQSNYTPEEIQAEIKRRNLQ